MCKKYRVLGTGNIHEIVPYTVSGRPQEMYKFHVVRNVHTMNRKCDLSYTFLGISQPRKFKISSSVRITCHPPVVTCNIPVNTFNDLMLQ